MNAACLLGGVVIIVIKRDYAVMVQPFSSLLMYVLSRAKANIPTVHGSERERATMLLRHRCARLYKWVCRGICVCVSKCMSLHVVAHICVQEKALLLGYLHSKHGLRWLTGFSQGCEYQKMSIIFCFRLNGSPF